MRRTAKLKVANLRALINVLTFVNGQSARGYFAHSDGNETQESDGRFISFDKYECSSGHMCKVSLGVVRSGFIEAFRRSFSIIRALHVVNRSNRACNRAVPPMVVFGTEECLIDRSAYKFLHVLAVEYLAERIRL